MSIVSRNYSRGLANLEINGQSKAYIEAQGHIFKVKVSSLPQVGGGLRGAVQGFSKASRKRLLEMLGRLDLKRRGRAPVAVFLTLTFAGEVPHPAEAKRRLFSFFKRIGRRWPSVSAVWRFEWTSSGEREYNPHFHVLLFGLPYWPKEQVQHTWNEVAGQRLDAPSTRIEAIHSWRGVMSYASKYVAKAADAASGLVYDAYLTEGIGRCWGVFNRECLPFAAKVSYSLTLGSERWFFDLKRAARHAWRWVNGNRWAGFTLFREDPKEWISLAAFYISQGGCYV